MNRNQTDQIIIGKALKRVQGILALKEEKKRQLVNVENNKEHFFELHDIRRYDYLRGVEQELRIYISELEELLK